jgi:hypothetical protein
VFLYLADVGVVVAVHVHRVHVGGIDVVAHVPKNKKRKKKEPHKNLVKLHAHVRCGLA